MSPIRYAECSQPQCDERWNFSLRRENCYLCDASFCSEQCKNVHEEECQHNDWREYDKP